MKKGLMTQWMLVLILLIINQTVSIEAELSSSQQYKGVIIANASYAKDIIQKQSKVVILFSDANCNHCQQFSQIFSLLSSIHNNDIHYVKIEYSEDTASFFNEHTVQDVPYIIAFSGGQPLPWHFQCLGSNNSVLVHLIKWAKRVYGQIGEWNSEDDHSHQLVVDCGQSGLRKMWDSISRTNLWLDVYCGSADFLGSSFAVVSQNGKSIEAWQFQRDNIHQLESKINRLILGYKYKYVLNWNVGIAQEIFVKKQNAFILIVNNESLSQQVFGYYEQAKKYWFQRSGGHEAPVLFVVSDLSKTTQETTRLKRYLTGMAVSMRKIYSYPILSFIYHEQDGRVSRYVLNFTLQKTKANIQQFMQSIHQHVILKNDYKQGETVIKKWLNEMVYNQQPLDKDKKQDGQTIKVETNTTNDKREMHFINNQTKWHELLDTVVTPFPFFVYVSWGHNLQLQKLAANLKRWWEKDKQAHNLFLSHGSHVSLYVNMLNTVDLPDHPGMIIEYVPTMLHIDSNKRVTQLAGVTDPLKIKNFITEQLKIHEQEYQLLK